MNGRGVTTEEIREFGKLGNKKRDKGHHKIGNMIRSAKRPNRGREWSKGGPDHIRGPGAEGYKKESMKKKGGGKRKKKKKRRGRTMNAHLSQQHKRR